MSFDYRLHFSRDPKVMGGQTVLKGTRVPLRTVLANLAVGHSVDEILREFPSLTREHVLAAIAFAADSAKDDIPSTGQSAA